MRRITYIQYTNPAAYPPLEHSSRILADAGWEVVFLGTGSLGAGDLRFPPHPRITVRSLAFQSAGWLQKLHYLKFCLWSFLGTLRSRADWIYASDLFACLPALFTSVVLRVPLLYHEHDSPAPGRSSFFLKACLLARKACARRASLCILPNRERARRFAAETTPRHSVEVVWNCPSKSEVLSAASEKPSQGLRLLYHGSIVPDRLPLTVLDALATLPEDVSLTIVGYETVGSKGYLDTLRDRASRFGILHRIEVVGAVPERDELLSIGRGCHVGLALMPMNSADSNLQTMTGASNKPFDYLACGLAVLVSDLPDWRELFVRPGYGLACDCTQPASIAAALRYLLDNPSSACLMGKKGQQQILADWNYERQFEMAVGHLSVITSGQSVGASRLRFQTPDEDEIVIKS
jgi:glycosyltransferase involved in cell wall biosynthesis